MTTLALLLALLAAAVVPGGFYVASLALAGGCDSRSATADSHRLKAKLK